MYISKLVIRNFRNFRRASFQFKPGVNTIIGENGSGKTNVFHALRLLLDSSLSYDSRNLVEKDFNRSLSDWRGHWIIISAFFSDLGSTEAEKLILYGLGNGETAMEGSYTLIFRPNLQVRTQLFALNSIPDRTQQNLKNVLNAVTLNDYEAIYLSRGNGDFACDSVYEELVGNFESITFPNPSELRFDKFGTKTQEVLSIHKEISCTFVQALRDVVRELRSNVRNPLLNLLSRTGNISNSSQSTNISGRIKELNHMISDLKEVKDLSANISKSLKSAVGKTYSPGVSIESSMPEEINELVKSLTILIGDAGDKDYLGRLNELSLGGANLLYLSLKLLEYELNHSEEKVAHFLLVEEPEAHIHKHIQRTLFEGMPLKQTQVFLSTHSTHISSASKISQMNALCIGDKEAKVYFPGNGIPEEELFRIERYLDSTRVSLLFAKGVILVEGDAEQIVIPALLQAVLGITADELGLSIINVSGTIFSHLGMLFDPSRIPRNCSIVTDLDQSILPLTSNPDQDSKEQTKCRNSQISGEERKKNLEDRFRDNPCVNLCFAKHTFEVDFVSSGNSSVVIECLDSIYQRNSDREASKIKLEDSDVAISGKEILRLAEKQGKGWFGILLSEKVSCQSIIPQYILESITFAASKQLIPEVLWDIAEYRIRKLSDLNISKYTKVSSETDKALSFEDKLKLFIKALPSDPLSSIISLLENNAKSNESQ